MSGTLNRLGPSFFDLPAADAKAVRDRAIAEIRAAMAQRDRVHIDTHATIAKTGDRMTLANKQELKAKIAAGVQGSSKEDILSVYAGAIWSQVVKFGKPIQQS